MKLLKWIFLGAMVVLVSACVQAPTQPVTLSGDFWQVSDQKVGIVMSTLPKPDVYLPGADCLLCMAVAEGNHSSLSKDVEQFETKDLQALPEMILAQLKARGQDAVILDSSFSPKKLKKVKTDDPQLPKYDYSSLVPEGSGVTHLLVVQVDLLGIHRPYASYVPTADPRAWFRGTSYIVDLENNRYSWYRPVEVFRASEITWDEPPEFPGLSNAYYQALAEGRSQILGDLK